MKKKTIIGIVAVVVIAGVAIGIKMCSGGNANGEVSFVTQKASRGSVGTSITATGTIEPVTEVTVGTQVSGIIDKIYIDYNSVVTKGQVIAEMDRVTLNSELLSQQATYDGALAEYNYQKKLYERNEKLHQKELISDTEYEETEYNYLRAKSTLKQAEANLAKAQRNLSYATITSPIDGIVTSREVEEGQTVASGYETPTLFTIAADLSKMQVVASVDEADIAGIAEGARAKFTVDAYPDDEFEGVVEQVRMGSENSTSSSSSTSSTTVVTYEVVITADNPDLKLKPRLTANVTIYTEEHTNVLLVPSKATRFTPNPLITGKYVVNDIEAENKVWTLSGNVLTAHAVELGLDENSMTEIISGIDENTEVVVEAKVAQAEEETTKTVSRSPFMPGPPGNDKDDESSDEEAEEE